MGIHGLPEVPAGSEKASFRSLVLVPLESLWAEAAHEQLPVMLQLRQGRSPLHQASFPLPSPEPWPNTHILSCQEGHSWETHLPSLCKTPQSGNSPGSAWVVQAPLCCKGIRYTTSQTDIAHPLSLVPQDWVLCKQGTKSSTILSVIYSHEKNK